MSVFVHLSVCFASYMEDDHYAGLKVWNVYPPLYWPGLDWYDWSETVLVAVW
jgi:hypothetical protein